MTRYWRKSFPSHPVGMEGWCHLPPDSPAALPIVHRFGVASLCGGKLDSACDNGLGAAEPRKIPILLAIRAATSVEFPTCGCAVCFLSSLHPSLLFLHTVFAVNAPTRRLIPCNCSWESRRESTLASTLQTFRLDLSTELVLILLCTQSCREPCIGFLP